MGCSETARSSRPTCAPPTARRPCSSAMSAPMPSPCAFESTPVNGGPGLRLRKPPKQLAVLRPVSWRALGEVLLVNLRAVAAVSLCCAPCALLFGIASIFVHHFSPFFLQLTAVKRTTQSVEL